MPPASGHPHAKRDHAVTYAIVTFGCRSNQADSLSIERRLLAGGAQAARAEDADLVIVNTCTVTATADQQARQAIRHVARQNPRGRIVVTGCYATRRPADVAALPNVVQVLVNDEKDRLAIAHSNSQAVLLDARARGQDDGQDQRELGIAPGVLRRTVYHLSVQTGCNEACAYCIVPAARGRSRSVPVARVVREVRRAAAAGFKEIVLTGVHLGAYGRDLTPPASLASLLGTLADEPLDVRYRLSAIEPMDCTAEVLTLVASSGLVAPHLHLPLQHASDRMLRAMRRPHDLATYRRLVDAVRERLPDAAIGTDVITGFPGETDEDFEQTCRYLEQSPLTSVHVFRYSDRPGTPAASMSPKVPADRSARRAGILSAVGRTLAERFWASQVGRVRRGLTLRDGTLVLTDNYLKVPIPPGRRRNEWLDVQIPPQGQRGTTGAGPNEGRVDWTGAVAVG